MPDCYCLDTRPRIGVKITEAEDRAYTATATYEVYAVEGGASLINGAATVGDTYTRAFYIPDLSTVNGFVRGNRYLSVITVTMTDNIHLDVVELCYRQYFNICETG